MIGLQLMTLNFVAFVINMGLEPVQMNIIHAIYSPIFPNINYKHKNIVRE